MITLITARYITLLLSLSMLLLFFSPGALSIGYLIIRPIVQPFAYQQYTLFGNVPLTAVFSIIVIAAAYLNGMFRRDQTLRHGTLLPLYLMLYFSLMSFFFTTDYGTSIGYLLKILTAVAFYVLVYNTIKAPHDRKKLLWAYLLSSIGPMLFGYYQYIAGTGHLWADPLNTSKRIDSFLAEWNAYGEYLSITICASMMLLLDQHSPRKQLLITGLLASLVTSLILSLNRGSWISLFIGFICASMVFRRKTRIGLAIIGLIVIFAAFGGVIYERFAELNELSPYGNPQNTLLGRIEAWATLVPLALERPIFGHGLGTSILTIQQKLKITFAPHNDYLRLTIEIGIIGAFFYILFLGICLWQAAKNNSNDRNWNINYPLTMMLIYFMIISFFQNIIDNVVVFPMFLGLIALADKSNLLLAEKTSTGNTIHARV